MKTKIFKQNNYKYLSVNDNIVCAFNETKNQFIRCTTVNITEKVIDAINDFRNIYNLEKITLKMFMEEFI
jgi:hypothetical protein|nr:MAG TPA: hypothetical protein [Caudoviricetes sp.]